MSVRLTAIFCAAVCGACGPTKKDEPTWMVGTFTSPDKGYYENPAAVGVAVYHFADDHTFVLKTWDGCPTWHPPPPPLIEPKYTYEGTWEVLDESTVLFSYTTSSGSESEHKLERTSCNEFRLRWKNNRGEWDADPYTTPLWRGEMCMFTEMCEGVDGSVINCGCNRGYCGESPLSRLDDDFEPCQSCPKPEPFVCDDEDSEDEP